MGRPKKPDRRDRQLNIRFTASELAAIAVKAGSQGIEPVEYGRQVLLQDRTLSGAATSLPSRFDQLVEVQLRRLGNLLNQLVRHLHQTSELLPEVTSVLEEVRALLRSMP